MTRAQMAAAHPTYVLPSEVTDEGWYRGPGKETDDECRARAKRVLERVPACVESTRKPHAIEQTQLQRQREAPEI